MKLFTLLLIPVFATLVSCGTTSGVKAADGKAISSSAVKFSKVVVRDFASTENDPKVATKVAIAKKSFPDMIVGELRNTGRFSKVSRSGSVDSETLVIGGTITDYDDGNAVAKMFIGFAAGNSNFNSNVNFSGAGKSLGNVTVDKNSWALGGALAAAQTAESFIPGAAKKVAGEALKFAK